MATLSFEEFQASRTESADVRMLLGADDEVKPLRGYVYAGDGGVIQVLDDGRPYLMIYNMEWIDMPLEELERILYDEFYLPEVCGRSD